MEIGKLEFHIHNWIYDTQGAEYCSKCHKFNRWLPGKITESYDSYLKSNWRSGWGYLLNGEEWLKKKNEEILWNGGLYF